MEDANTTDSNTAGLSDSYGIYLTHQIVGSLGRAAIDFAVVGLSGSGKSFFNRLPETVENPFARIAIWIMDSRRLTEHHELGRDEAWKKFAVALGRKSSSAVMFA
jgi:hypothetical protein